MWKTLDERTRHGLRLMQLKLRYLTYLLFTVGSHVCSVRRLSWQLLAVQCPHHAGDLAAGKSWGSLPHQTWGKGDHREPEFMHCQYSVFGCDFPRILSHQHFCLSAALLGCAVVVLCWCLVSAAFCSHQCTLAAHSRLKKCWFHFSLSSLPLSEITPNHPSSTVFTTEFSLSQVFQGLQNSTSAPPF